MVKPKQCEVVKWPINKWVKKQPKVQITAFRKLNNYTYTLQM